MGKIKSNADSYYMKYEKISNEMFEELKKKYFIEIDKARNWKTAHQLFQEAVIIPLTNKHIIELRQLGTVTYDFFHDWDNTFDLDKTKEREEIFNEMIEAIEVSKRDESVRQLAILTMNNLWMAFWLDQYKQRDHLYEYAPKDNYTNDQYLSPIFWNKKNGTEFVQLIYALHEAGYIENEEKEITKLVLQVADVFNIDLGKHWQSNFSKSINNRKADYKPKIFADLQKALLSYRDVQINKKKKN